MRAEASSFNGSIDKGKKPRLWRNYAVAENRQRAPHDIVRVIFFRFMYRAQRRR
jgi:hypothetical protein